MQQAGAGEGPGRCPPPDDLLGRGEEWAALRRELQAAADGAPRTVLVLGEPGIGKTDLVTRLAAAAEDEGAQVVECRAHARTGQPGLWPWRRLVAVLDPASSAESRLLATAFPGVLPEVAPGPAELSSAARHRLFEAVRLLVEDAARRRPLVVVVDDLHWLDPGSLLLLEVLATEPRRTALLLVATCRPDEVETRPELARVVEAVSRADRTRVLRLRPLAPPLVAALVRRRLGGRATDDVVAHVVERADGNPLFAGQLVEWLEEQPPGSDPSRLVTAVPWQVHLLVRERLAALEPEAGDVVRAAAVAGLPVDVQVLAQVTGLPVDAVLRGAEQAVARHLLVRAAPDRLAFVHALVRDAVAESVPAADRARLHAGLADVLSAREPQERELAALAAHATAAAALGEPALLRRALEANRAAAVAATRLLAPEQAEHHLVTALELARRCSVEPAERLELLLLLGEARDRSGHAAAAKEAFLAAADLARDLGDPRTLARAAVGYRLGLAAGFLFAPPDPQLLRLLEEAREALRHDDDPLAVQVTARLALERYTVASVAERRALCDEALRRAARLQDLALLADTLLARHLALWSPVHVHRQLQDTTRVLETAERLGDPELALQAHYWRVPDALQLGDRALVDSDVAQVTHLAARLRQPVYDWWALCLQASQSLLDGDLREGERRAAAALDAGAPVKPENAVQVYGAQLLLLRWEQGRLGEVKDAVRRALDEHPGSAGWKCAAVFVGAHTGDPDAGAAFARLVDAGLLDAEPDFLYLVSAAQLAEVAVLLDDPVRAAVVADRLRPHAGQWIPVGPASACFGPVDRLLGRLALVGGRTRDALDHLEQALAATRAFRAPLWTAHVQVDLAEGLLRTGTAADAARARELLAAALQTARAAGADALAERAARAVGSPGAAGLALTPREREVADLARQGLRLRDIGAQLGISERTVETHLRHVYDKLGVRSRIDLVLLEPGPDMLGPTADEGTRRST